MLRKVDLDGFLPKAQNPHAKYRPVSTDAMQLFARRSHWPFRRAFWTGTLLHDEVLSASQLHRLTARPKFCTEMAYCTGEANVFSDDFLPASAFRKTSH